jgi:hypothetical protein
MPSKTYIAIWRAIRQREQIVFSYHGRPREAFPIILGYSADGREVVFIYQVGGETTEGKKLPDWRCCYVGEIANLETRPAQWREGAGHKQAQTCVQSVDVDVNVPDTLTRPKPLPFGHPDLRRTRGQK